MGTKTTITLIIFMMFSVLLGCSEDGDDSNPLNIDENHPPEIQEQADTFIAVGETLILQAVASDIDGDSLKFSSEAHVTWSEILDGEIPNIDTDGKTGMFRFVPADYDVPERLFTFIVDDYNGGLDSTSFIVTVIE
jgi:hypothetical protein